MDWPTNKGYKLLFCSCTTTKFASNRKRKALWQSPRAFFLCRLSLFVPAHASASPRWRKKRQSTRLLRARGACTESRPLAPLCAIDRCATEGKLPAQRGGRQGRYACNTTTSTERERGRDNPCFCWGGWWELIQIGYVQTCERTRGTGYAFCSTPRGRINGASGDNRLLRMNMLMRLRAVAIWHCITSSANAITIGCAPLGRLKRSCAHP